MKYELAGSFGIDENPTFFLTTGINNTGSKIAAGIKDTDSKFATDINDTGRKFATGINDTGRKFFNQFHLCC